MYPKLRSQKLKTMSGVCYSLAIVYFVLRIVGCSGNEADLSESKLDSNWHLQSSAFAEGGEIPEQLTCEGADISPALSWSDSPSGTQNLALLMDDPDAPGGHSRIGFCTICRRTFATSTKIFPDHRPSADSTMRTRGGMTLAKSGTGGLALHAVRPTTTAFVYLPSTPSPLCRPRDRVPTF